MHADNQENLTMRKTQYSWSTSFVLCVCVCVRRGILTAGAPGGPSSPAGPAGPLSPCTHKQTHIT